ncbi:MAG: CDP-glucose 4,6-dehydratase [Eubacteriales bacterium]
MSHAVVDPSFWNGKRVLLTGHTGFKGSWMSIWLKEMGTKLTGFALTPPTSPSLFEDAHVAEGMMSVIGDIRDPVAVRKVFADTHPEIVIHMAAQPLVRESYKFPAETYAINVMGTVNVLEAVRHTPGVRSVVIVTTDKCYENREWIWGYRENEPMGGYDPYSSSKGCAELVTSSYRHSYFNPSQYGMHNVALASARAGNVIGGGDWADDRLIPDIMRAVMAGNPVNIRSPYATRPWQHVLEPVGAYLLLAQKLFSDGPAYSEGWNIGPRIDEARDVEYIVRTICKEWGEGASFFIDANPQPHEAGYLKLDISKIENRLDWHPVWHLPDTIEKTVFWYKAYARGQDARELCLSQLRQYIIDSRE